ncbi:MAG TPA: hypothetical protein VGV88_12675 [Candidatus Dormibacteraeota bacterium]|nr:hypothetical protein [Candidatus Dormibacteraeota bacterium]
MLRCLAACAAGVVCLAGCAGTIASPTSSPARMPGATSAAADVRTRLSLLMGEHTYVVAKLTVAAVAGRKGEFGSYADLLAANGVELGGVLTTAIGETAGQRLAESWTRGNGFFVDYIVAVTTRQQNLADAAMMNLNSAYVPRMAEGLSTPLNISASSANRMLLDQVTSTKQFIDDAVAGSPTSFYADLRAAYAKSTAMGGSIAEGIVWKFPDKYPGDVMAQGAKTRAQLDASLQEHAYLLSMATDAASSGATAEAGAATSSLQANDQELSNAIASAFSSQAGARAAQLWGDEDKTFMAYASAADDAAKSAALNALDETSTPGFTAFLNGLHVTADIGSVTHQTIGVIDDQRAMSYSVLAAEDRQSAALLISIGDLMMAAAG